MVEIYVDGKRVTEDELEKIELHQEEIRQMFAEKMNMDKKEKETA